MRKIKKVFSCNNCGAISNKWPGQCSDYGQRVSIVEELAFGSKILVPKSGAVQELDFLNHPVIESIRVKNPY